MDGNSLRNEKKKARTIIDRPRKIVGGLFGKALF